jgi:Aspartyl protease
MLYTVGILAALLSAAIGGDAVPTPLPRMVPLFTASGEAPIVLPAVFDDRVLLHADIDGHAVWLHLDTGTSSLVLGGQDAKALGATLDPVTHYTQPLAVEIGPVNARARFQILATYGFVDNGRRISGLIGGPFFHANVVTVDYPNQRVIFYPPGTFTPPQGVTPTPIELMSNTPTVEATIGSEGGHFLLDTGSSVTELSGAFAKKVRLGFFHGNVITAGGGLRSEGSYDSPDIVFAGFTIRRPRVLVATEPRVPVDGIIGRNILSNFSLTFDYANQVVYIAR